MTSRVVHVAVGVIERDGRVLIARRPDHAHQGGLLEFPGGKVEPGETVQQALVREIHEETGLALSESSLRPVITIRHDYGDKCVLLDVWRTDAAHGQAVGREGQPVEWRQPASLQDAEFPAANRPIIRALRLPDTLALTGRIRSAAQGLDSLSSSFAHGVPALTILRAPGLADSEYQSFALQAVALAQRHRAGALVHGSPERFGQTPGAAGLHLPWREAQALERRPIPAERWLGVSCHNAEQLAHAEAIGADYAVLGAVLPTPSHPGEPGMGWEDFAGLVSAARLPVYALGGMRTDHLEMAKHNGAQGIAGIGFWWHD
ncbi:MAG: Nudix family hydrolase [Pseudomonadota bacterium]|nr:Nudix family hydrolase [Pseudomonadota bacterium]